MSSYNRGKHADVCHRSHGLIFSQSQYSHTDEARLAQTGRITYKQALLAIYDRRHAFSTARPFSARVIGQGHSFLYRQSTVCVLEGDTVHISDTHAQSEPIQLQLKSVLRPILESTFASTGEFKYSILNYSHGILAVHAIGGQRADGGHVFAVDTAADLSDKARVIQGVHVPPCSKLFVRHNARYLYYGTHTGMGDDGHHKWEINAISLNKKYPLPKRERPVVLDDFHGTDIGSTVTFEIFNDYFYAVSNQGTFEVEEIDYTSFYHFVRIPLDQPLQTSMKSNKRLYRRQHSQGPIHDSWTDLTLQLDERTNQVAIVESRREWAQASSRQSRTFYVTKNDFDKDPSSGASSPVAGPSDPINLPVNPLNDLLDSTNNPNYAPTPDEWSWSQHPEFSKYEVSPRSFILARTKFRAYNYSCTSFLDLVEDDRCCNNPYGPPCLRLRIGGRREIGDDPTDPTPKPPPKIDPMAPRFVDDKTEYRHLPVRMFPPRSSQCPCSARLHSIMNPPLSNTNSTRTITGILDKHSLVYMVKPGRSYGADDANAQGVVVLVNFSRPLDIKPADANIGAGPHSTPLLARRDSKMDDVFNPSSWTWSPKLDACCREKTCQ